MNKLPKYDLYYPIRLDKKVEHYQTKRSDRVTVFPHLETVSNQIALRCDCRVVFGHPPGVVIDNMFFQRGEIVTYGPIWVKHLVLGRRRGSVLDQFGNPAYLTPSEIFFPSERGYRFDDIDVKRLKRIRWRMATLDAILPLPDEINLAKIQISGFHMSPETPKLISVKYRGQIHTINNMNPSR